MIEWPRGILLQDLLELLRSLGDIEELVLRYAIRPNSGDLACCGSAAVLLPSLKHLDLVHNSPRDIYHLLHLIVAPTLETLNVNGANIKAHDAEASLQLELVELILSKSNYNLVVPLDQRRVTVRGDHTGVVTLTLMRCDFSHERWQYEFSPTFFLRVRLQAADHSWVVKFLEIVDPRELGYTQGFSRYEPPSELVMRACPSVRTLAFAGVGDIFRRAATVSIIPALARPDIKLMTRNLRAIVFSCPDFGELTVMEQVHASLNSRQLEAVYIFRPKYINRGHINMIQTFARHVHCDGVIQYVAFRVLKRASLTRLS
jgi:hypothetical protein